MSFGLISFAVATAESELRNIGQMVIEIGEHVTMIHAAIARLASKGAISQGDEVRIVCTAAKLDHLAKIDKLQIIEAPHKPRPEDLALES
jgi:hypothetical protein